MEKDPFGLRVAPELLEKMLGTETPVDALRQLESYWSSRAGQPEDQPATGLSRTEFDVHLLLLYLAEVAAGGHRQFFVYGTGNVAAEVLEALERLGLLELRLVLSEACSLFPAESVPKNADERQALVAALPPEELARWAALDETVRSIERVSWKAVLNRLRARGDDVLVDE
jgi:hypothetical protein